MAERKRPFIAEFLNATNKLAIAVGGGGLILAALGSAPTLIPASMLLILTGGASLYATNKVFPKKVSQAKA